MHVHRISEKCSRNYIRSFLFKSRVYLTKFKHFRTSSLQSIEIVCRVVSFSMEASEGGRHIM